MKVYGYLLTAGADIALPPIPAPETTWDSPLSVANATLEHERVVTANWQSIADRAVKDGDHATKQLSQWFVTEQMEEEDVAVKLVQRLKLAGDGPGLLVIDQELGQR